MLVTPTEPINGQTPSHQSASHQTQPSTPSRTPSILDSPTLARVERARLRLEASNQQQSNGKREDSLERSILDPKQSLLAGRIPVASMTGPIKRGLLWQQRDRLFSRWKERYFVLTRDYLHCFKRASGSANERASDMGQFIFKVKLVDVEKVEWLNRRSYSAIGLLLGREGRVLLRCDEGLEDWFELLEECTLTSKERRRALKITQGPRSRASLAAPVSHASLQAHHFGLGGTYSSALDDWRHYKLNGNSANPFLFSDSVPDLSALNNENHNSGISTNHSTPQKIPYSNNLNLSRYSNGYASQNSSFSNGLYGSPRRIFINSSFGSNQVVDEEDEEVQLRRPRMFKNNNENGNELDRDWLYRKPRAPTTDTRHSVQTTDLDYTANDSGLDTPPSTHRPSSYRDINHASPRDSTETTVSSSRGTLLHSPGGSFRSKHLNHITNLNQSNTLNGSRYSVQERVLKIRNEEDRCLSIKSVNRLNHNEMYDPNQNRYYKMMNGNQSLTPTHTSAGVGVGNGNGNGNTSTTNSGSGIFRERYQHPALAAIINESQGIKFRDRSYSDCQQGPPRRSVNNNPSPTPRRAPIFGTPTRV